MLVAFIISYILLIFPLFLNVKVVFNYSLKKAFFILELFGFIKLVSGYIQLKKNSVYFHVSDKKAILFELIDYKGVKESFKPFMDYHFISLKTICEFGSSENENLPLSIAFLLNYVQSYFKWFLFHKKAYVVFENQYILFDQNRLNFYGKTVVVLNLLMIIISIIKILVEKLVYGFTKLKQQN